MDTSTAPEPKIMLALTLRYAEDNEEAADRYLRAALRFFMFDLYPHEAFELVRTFAIDTADNIRDLEGEEVASRIGAALRQLIDRAEADKAFMAGRAEPAEPFVPPLPEAARSILSASGGLSAFRVSEGRCVLG